MAPQSFYVVKEKQANRTIRALEVNDTEITEPEEIIKVMQEWYEKTAHEQTVQTVTLHDFLNQRGIQLPQVTEDQVEDLQQEFTIQEVKDALSEAEETSAPLLIQNLKFFLPKNGCLNVVKVQFWDLCLGEE
jgi:hypothetical protein